MPGVAYPDSSFLVSLYRRDGNHDAASAFLQKHSPELLFSPLHRVEVRNALRVAQKQGLVTMQELRQAFAQIEEDLREGFLIHSAMGLGEICRRADELSEKYGSKHPSRAIDLLHVGAALACGHKLFLSFDHRQRDLAKAAGLQVKP